MAFRPIIGDVALMDPRIYQSKPMGLAATLQDLQRTDHLCCGQ
jgi:propionate CoA-transferase